MEPMLYYPRLRGYSGAHRIRAAVYKWLLTNDRGMLGAATSSNFDGLSQREFEPLRGPSLMLWTKDWSIFTR
jgi:hypothetical protein